MTFRRNSINPPQHRPASDVDTSCRERQLSRLHPSDPLRGVADLPQIVAVGGYPMGATGLAEQSASPLKRAASPLLPRFTPPQRSPGLSLPLPRILENRGDVSAELLGHLLSCSMDLLDDRIAVILFLDHH